MRQSIQDWTKYILWKRAFKKLKGYGLLMVCLSRPYPSNLKTVFHKIYLINFMEGHSDDSKIAGP